MIDPETTDLLGRRSPPVRALVLRVGHIPPIVGTAPLDDPPIPGSDALYRLVEGGMPICARHLAEIGMDPSGIGEGALARVARAVLTLDQIDALVVEFGLRRDDLRSLHGPQDPILGEERCRMCDTMPVDGNVCHRDGCRNPLHPQWPAVYCSLACALDDA